MRKLRDPETQRFLTQEMIRWVEGVCDGTIPVKTTPEDPTPQMSREEEDAALKKEMDESSPRAALALAEALFSEYLQEDVLVQLSLCHEDDQRRSLNIANLRKAVPRTLEGRINLAYALDILPAEALPLLQRARNARNNIIHKAGALTPDQVAEAKLATDFFLNMRMYLVLVKSFRPEERVSPVVTPMPIPYYDESDYNILEIYFRFVPLRLPGFPPNPAL